jgi:hypothetical protein
MKNRILIVFLMLWAAIGQGQEVSIPAIPALSFHNVRVYSNQNPAYFISPERTERWIKGDLSRIKCHFKAVVLK